MRPKCDIMVRLTRDQKMIPFKHESLLCFPTILFTGVITAEDMWLMLVEIIENDIDPKICYTNDMQRLYTYLKLNTQTNELYTRMNLHDFHHDFLHGCSHYEFIEPATIIDWRKEGF